jgi:1-acyl-sn-glycerol-3-phosphate acyltransferase
VPATHFLKIAYFSIVFYRLLKIYARFAIKIYLYRIRINKPEVLKESGPILLACNHPNSFLDGIIITTLFDDPVHSLARGDVFKKKWVAHILRKLQLLPVYRTSEGAENLEYNYATFIACQETFEKKEIVLVFSEGKCENEWHLRPLKKGTARVAVTAWQKGVPLKVIPTAVNYSSFNKFGKEVHLYFGEAIVSSEVINEESEGKKLLRFNELLNAQLGKIVYEIKPGDEYSVRKIFSIKKQPSFFLLLLPGIIGCIVHAPLFYACKLVQSKFSKTVHYDSVLTSLLLIVYPVYLLVCSLIAYNFDPLYGLASFLFMPIFAWAAVQFKYQLTI